MKLDSPLTGISGIGEKTAELFANLEIHRLRDLIFTFPRQYLDYSRTVTLAELQPDKKNTVIARVESFKNVYLRRGRMKSLQKAVIADDSGKVDVVWFNMPFLESSVVVGEHYAFVAALSHNRKTGKPQLNSPLFEKISGNMVNTARIVPVYKLTQGLSPKLYRRYLQQLLANLDLYADEIGTLPEAIITRENLYDLSAALRQVHFPDNFKELKRAKKTLGVWELLPIQKKLLLAARERARAHAVTHASIVTKQLRSPAKGKAFVKSYWRNFPFEPTIDQVRASEDLLADFTTKPIYRLVQGDVGSGKTAVAGFAAALALETGFDVVLMVPTTVLASQHYESLQKIFGERMQLVTANTDIGKKKLPKQKQGARLLIGTQALLHRYENLNMNLGMLIVDEEHRFGVKQRELLAKIAAGKSVQRKKLLPHYLSLTATPIPRTLALSLFGNIDLSVIRTKPKQQLEKKTYLVPEYKRADSYQWIRTKITEGNQVFWICPLIEEVKEVENEPALLVKDDKASVDKLARELKTIFPQYKLAKLHGKLPADKKQTTLASFRNGKQEILVSTTVIEVGIDVPAANIIVIEGAENFGLAQLHQLRGRVGRGDKQGYCLLFPSHEFDSTTGKQSLSRLQFFSQENDGLKLAEYDLRERGPGEVYGTIQSGIPNLKIANIADPEQLRISKEIAELELK